MIISRFAGIASILSLAIATGCAVPTADADGAADTAGALGDFDRTNPDIDVVRCGPVASKPAYLLTFLRGIDGLVSAKVLLDANVAGRPVKAKNRGALSPNVSGIYGGSSLAFGDGDGKGIMVTRTSGFTIIDAGEYKARLAGSTLYLTSSDGIESTLRGSCVANTALIDAELKQFRKDK